MGNWEGLKSSGVNYLKHTSQSSNSESGTRRFYNSAFPEDISEKQNIVPGQL
jgi:hypothetical protein